MKKNITINKRNYSLIIFLLSIHFFTGSVLKAQQSNNVLFLGNSYTGVNNLPQIIRDVALSAGDTLIFDSYTPGGYKLTDHNSDVVTQGKIIAGGWDYVVMQGQSQEAITSNISFESGARNINLLISEYNPCAVPMLYMTWGRKNGDASNCASYPVMCTYEGMDSTIRNNYLELASSIHAEVSPVSIAWNYLRQNYPGIELYTPDESHPSAAGSYAAACCSYATIFKKDPTLITFNYSLSATDASIIKNAVKTEVFDNFSFWDFKQVPASDFEYEIGAGVNEISFHAENLVDTYLWDFGDGTTSSSRNPTHSYSSDGTYIVVLTATNCDLQGVHTSITDTIISFCSHTPIVSTSNPWLCSVDTLWALAADSYQWIVLNGSGWTSIPETNQYLPDYMQYGFDFAVMTTVGSCTELSQRFSATPSSSLYYVATVGVGGASMADTALLIIMNLFGGESIQWYKNNSVMPFETNDTLIITTGGTYHHTITNSNCPLDTTFTSNYIPVIGPTGIEDNVRDPFWSIAPNPVTEVFTIKFERAILNERVQIYSATGQLVREKEASAITVIDISALPAGIYFIRLKNNDQPALKCIKL